MVTSAQEKVIEAAKGWLRARQSLSDLKGPEIIQVMARVEFALCEAVATLAEEESLHSTDDKST